MEVLSLWILRGHFVWCPYFSKQGECDRCKALAYGFALILTATMAGVQFWTSAITGSLPLKGDSWHMVIDSLGYIIGFVGSSVWVVLLLARYEILVTERATERAMVIALVLAIVIILMEAWERWSEGKAPTILRGDLLLSVAILGLCVNGLLYVLLRAFGIEHDHHHDHHASHVDKRLRANVQHTLTDFISSLAVVGSALVVRWFSQSDLLRYVDVGVPILIVYILSRQVYEIIAGW